MLAPRPSPRGWLAIALAAIVTLPCLAAAQFGEPPGFDLKDPAIVEDGRKLFNQRCAGRCHGADGREGFDGPILVGKAYLDRAYSWATLLTGRPGSAMPAWNDRLTNDELWKIIAFMSALGDQARGASR